MELRVESLGAKGDGIATAPDGGAPVFVPFALPGERVAVPAVDAGGRAAAPVAIVDASPERQVPPCPHFGDCGGCDLQHAGDALYRRFKRDLVVDAFAARGLSPPVADLVPCPPAARRRATFTAARSGGRLDFGFHARGSDRIVPLHVCHVVVPAITTALQALRALAERLAPRRGELRVTVFAAVDGLDVTAIGAGKLDAARRQAALTHALRHGWARLTVDGETLVETAAPTLTFDAIPVAVPPGAFLQAVASAEATMAALVCEHLAGCQQVADLFAGLGTFALRLARRSAVRAVESDAPALQALDRARRGVAGLKPVALERRDLFRRPLTAKDLAGVAGVAFDPPRAGAEAQSHALAASGVERIAAVSCNPATLARDCRILGEGGYRILQVTPVDQFLWSHHVEAVALLTR